MIEALIGAGILMVGIILGGALMSEKSKKEG